jgi:hypothetical protein
MSEKRRFLKTEGLKIDQLTFEWIIKTKIFLCPEIAETCNENFKVSEGWLEKFRIHHERNHFQMQKPLNNLVWRMTFFWLPMRK